MHITTSQAAAPSCVVFKHFANTVEGKRKYRLLYPRPFIVGKGFANSFRA